MYKEYEINTGDIGVVIKPKSFLGRLIAIFDKPHAFMLIRHYNTLYVYEMKVFGLNVMLYSDSYINENGWVILKPKIEYSEKDIKKIQDFCESINRDSIRYDTVSLLKHLYSKILNKYPLEKKRDLKYICSELCAIITNYAKPYIFPAPESVTPKSILNNKNFYIYEKQKV
jgi:hypothetical protein